MKKKLVMLLVITLVASLFVGCAKEAAAPADNSAKTDVLVIGGGGAGLVSAITAAENGANVILVEKMPMVGGNTIISATGISAADSSVQAAAGVTFTVEDLVKRTMEAGKDLPNEELVRILAENSSSAIDWLLSLGLAYKMHPTEAWTLVPVEGHFGSLMIAAYKKEAEKLKNLEIRVNNKATDLVIEEGKVVGAKVTDKNGKEYTITANAVVMATGGLGNAPDIIAEYNPKFTGAHGVMSTAGPSGEGFKMAVTAGAGVVDMEYHQMRPLATPGYWIRETVISEEGLGGILVNKDGLRFTNETLKPLQLVPEVLAQKDNVGYVIFDSEVFTTPNGKAAVEKGNMIQADSIEELATKLGLDSATVNATVEAYNTGIDEFGRETMGKITAAPFYGVMVQPSSHYTMGGLAFNENAEISDENGNPIPGLYGAGEILGGLYGAGRVYGNNTLDDIVFGKIAGKNAAAFK